jgi:hypothetical protein
MKNKKILSAEKSHFSLGKRKLPYLSLTFLFAVFSILNNTNPLHAQWVSTGGPGSGASVRCLTLNGSNLYAGSSKVEWNIIKYLSRVYFYTLTSEFYNQTKRKALIK